jgi:hypothetical protein
MNAKVEGSGLDVNEVKAGLSVTTSIRIAEETINSVAPIAAQLSNGELDIPSFELTGSRSRIGFLGRLDTSERFSISTEIEVPLEPLSVLIGGDSHLEGYLELSVSGDGNLDSPIFTCKCLVEDLGTRDLTFRPDILLSASYSDESLKLSEISAQWGQDKAKNRILAAGNIPARIRLSSRIFDLLEDPMLVSLDGDLGDLSFLSSLSPAITKINGRSDFQLSFGGTPSAIEPNGEAHVALGEMVLRDLVKPIRDMEISVNAGEGSVSFDPISLHIDGGSISSILKLSLNGILPMSVETSVDFSGIRIEDLIEMDYSPMLNLEGQVSGNASMLSDISDLGPLWGTDVFALLKEILRRGNGHLTVDSLALYLNDRETKISDEISGRLQGGVFDLSPFRLSGNQLVGSPINMASWLLWEIDNRLVTDVVGDIDLSVFGPLEEMGCSGMMEFRFEMRGTERDPSLSFSWNIPEGKHVTIRKAESHDISGTVTYDQGVLRIGEVSFAIGRDPLGARMRVFGYMPAKFELPYFSMTFPEEAMEFTMDANVESMAFVPLVLQDIVSAQGKGSVSLTVGGTPISPNVSGAAEFTSLSLDYLPSAVSIKDTQLTAVFSDRGIEIQPISGILNGGRYSASGTIGLVGLRPGKLDISGMWTSSVFYEPSLYNVRSGGDLTLKGTFDLPVLSGTVMIDELTFSQSLRQILSSFLSPVPETRAIVIFDAPLLRGMELDLEVQAPGDVRVNAGIASVESKFSGTVRGPINRFIFVGESDIVSGELVYLNRRFEIIEGHIENTNQLRFNPKYAIVAKTVDPIRGVPLEDLDSSTHIRDVEVTITMSGTLDQPASLILSADVLGSSSGEEYELDTRDIMSILTTGRTSADISGLQSTALEVFQRQAESWVASVLGFQQLEIKLDTADIDESRFFFTRELSPKLSVSVSSIMGLHSEIYSETSVQVEYELPGKLPIIDYHLPIVDRWSIISEKSVGGKYGVDLRLEYEFGK